MNIYQKEILLVQKPRGFHLISKEIISAIPELKMIRAGMLNVFICHTSASLTINENADPDVRTDFETHFNTMVPENTEDYLHTSEGPDDMTKKERKDRVRFWILDF